MQPIFLILSILILLGAGCSSVSTGAGSGGDEGDYWEVDESSGEVRGNEEDIDVSVRIAEPEE